MGDHSESIQVQFDSRVILYRELLEIFWREHHPLQPASSSQYRSAVFYHTPDQERLARQVKAEQEANRGHTLYTALESAGHFFPAEDYHQKYYLQRRKELMALLEKIYPDRPTLYRAVLPARLNALVGGDVGLEIVRQAFVWEKIPSALQAQIEQLL